MTISNNLSASQSLDADLADLLGPTVVSFKRSALPKAAAIAAASPLLSAGLALHWLHPRAKIPIATSWSTAPVHTLDTLTAAHHECANLGIRLGDPSRTAFGYLHLIDMDVRDPARADEARAELAKIFPEASEAPSVISGSGGASRHFYFLCPTPFRSTKLAHSTTFKMVMDEAKGREVKHWDWEIELFGTAKQAVLPPSIHPKTGLAYAWERPLDLDGCCGVADIIRPGRVEDWGGVPAAPEPLDADDLAALMRQAPIGLTLEQIGEILDLLPEDYVEDRDQWYRTGMAVHHETRGSHEGFDRWAEWSMQSPKFNARNQRQVWKSFKGKRTAPLRMPTLIKASGWKGATAPVSLEQGKVLRTKGGEVAHALHNAVVFLGKVLGDRRLRWNLLAGGAEISNGEAEPHRVDDHNLAALRVEIECAGMQSLGKELVQDAVRLLARKDAYHPVQEHLAALPAHDKIARLDTWLTDYLGVVDTAGTRAVGRKFLIAMVARVELPGCKADNMLVLGGAQDLGKSTVCQILADRPEWFLDALPPISKDGGDPAMKALRGKWVVEMSELVATRKSDQEDLKAFLSRQVDDYRVTFDREQTAAPRQCVFIGTTNKREFLRDETGDRRYWPVWCEGPLKLDELKRDRAQLLAEALAAFKGGEAWHLDRDEAALARVMQAAHAESDPWDDTLRRALEVGALAGRDEMTMAELLQHGLCIDPERQTMATQKRAAAALRRLGWETGHTRAGKRWRRADADMELMP